MISQKDSKQVSLDSKTKTKNKDQPTNNHKKTEK